MKRALALLLACLLTMGCALAEGPELAPMEQAADEAVYEIDGPLFENDVEETPSEETPAEEAPGEETPVEEPPAEEPEAPVPTVISIKKNATKTVYLGTLYQFVVPGKTVKSYSSNHKSRATVDEKTGVIKLKRVSTVKITAKLKNGKKVVLTLNVADPTVPASVSIAEGKSLTAYIGEKVQLNAVVSPATADQTVKWHSSKRSVAKVNKSGLLKPVKAGKATITATTVNKKTVSITVTVKQPPTPPYTIAHAMGGVEGNEYSNSLEAFLENYEEGYRIFEVDFEYTSDGEIVLCHDWKNLRFPGQVSGKKPTYAQFMGSKIYGKYTPMDLDALLSLMMEYPDVTIVTDSKYPDTATAKKQFNTLLSKARELGAESALDRMIVEVYNKDMYKAVKGIYPFKGYIFILYKLYKKAPSKAQFKDIAAFCKKNGIKTVSMSVNWWKAATYLSILQSNELDMALFTVNGASDAQKLFDGGVTALFTDFLPPLGNDQF